MRRAIVLLCSLLVATQANAQGSAAAYRQNQTFAAQSRLAETRRASTNGDLARAVEQRVWSRPAPAPSASPYFNSDSGSSRVTPAADTSWSPLPLNPGYDTNEDPLKISQRILAESGHGWPATPDAVPAQNASERREAERRDALRRDTETLSRYFGNAGGRDARAAVQTATPLAEQGNASAALVLAIAHLSGDGAARDNRQALAWMQRSASASDPVAQLLLGEMQLAGIGAPADPAAALAQFELAAGAGFAPAQLRLAQRLLERSDGAQPDYVRALRVAETAMEQLPKAGFEVGLIRLSNRPGVPRDPVRAAAALQRAAAAGHAQAQYVYALCQQAGIGTARDAVAAMAWYRKAAESGVPPAQLRLGEAYAFGLGLPPDRQQALRWLEPAARGGEAAAHNLIGVVLSGPAAAAADLPRAIESFRRGAELGDAAAQYNLGVATLEGIAAPADARQGADWLARAADRGYAQAQFHVGLLHLLGESFAKDDPSAVRRFTQAASQGHAQAMDELCGMALLGQGGLAQFAAADPGWLPPGVQERQPACLYMAATRMERGVGTPRDPQRGVALLRQSAELGYHHAEFSLGQLYLAGMYVAADPAQGSQWVRRAAEHGNKAAQRLLQQAGQR